MTNKCSLSRGLHKLFNQVSSRNVDKTNVSIMHLIPNDLKKRNILMGLLKLLLIKSSNLTIKALEKLEIFQKKK